MACPRIYVNRHAGWGGCYPEADPAVMRAQWCHGGAEKTVDEAKEHTRADRGAGARERPAEEPGGGSGLGQADSGRGVGATSPEPVEPLAVGGGQRPPTNQLTVMSRRPVSLAAWRVAGLLFLWGLLPFQCPHRLVARSLRGVGSRACVSEHAPRVQARLDREQGDGRKAHHRKGIIMSKQTTTKLVLGALLLVSGVASTACSSLGNSTSEYRNQHIRQPHRFNRPPRERRGMATRMTSDDTQAVKDTEGSDV